MIKMCSLQKSGEDMNDDPPLESENSNHNQETMSPEGKFINRFFQQLSLNEASEELVSLGKIAGPVLMTNLLLYSRNIISMLFLGHLGEFELAGGVLALAFANVTGFSILKGLSMGMDPICGQAFGAKRWSVVSQTYQKTACLLLVLCIPISLLWLNVEPILQLLGQDKEITKTTMVYLAFNIPELLAQAHLFPLRTFLRTQGITAPLTVASTCATILHFPVNYFLAIYLDLGMRGVALALACNTVNLNIGLLIYVAFSKTSLKPWRGFTIVSLFQGWKPLLTLALPSVCSICLEWWWYEIMLFLSGLLNHPQSVVAAMGILIQTTGLLYVFPYALSTSLATRIGQALGAGQPSRAQWSAIIGFTLAVAFGLSAFAFTYAVRSVWGKLYTGEPEILELISTALPVLGFCEVFNSPQTASCGVVTGCARPSVGARINLCAFYLVGLPVALYMAFSLNLGFVGLWYGLAAAQISCSCMMVYTLIKTDWKHQAKRAEELTLTAGEKEDLKANLVPDV